MVLPTWLSSLGSFGTETTGTIGTLTVLHPPTPIPSPLSPHLPGRPTPPCPLPQVPLGQGLLGQPRGLTHPVRLSLTLHLPLLRLRSSMSRRRRGGRCWRGTMHCCGRRSVRGGHEVTSKHTNRQCFGGLCVCL